MRILIRLPIGSPATRMTPVIGNRSRMIRALISPPASRISSTSRSAGYFQRKRSLGGEQLRDIDSRMVQLTFDSLVPRDKLPSLDFESLHRPINTLLRVHCFLHDSGLHLEKSKPQIERRRVAWLHEALGLHRPRLRAAALAIVARHDNAELPAHLVFHSAGAIGIEQVAFVKHRIGDFLGPFEFHPLSLSSECLSNDSTASSQVGSAWRPLNRYSASKLSRLSRIHALPGK